MSDQASQLLALLGNGVRPFDVGDLASVVDAGPDFSALLARARSGNPETGLAVGLPPELETLLSVDQREMLAGAVDRVAVVGAESALIRLGERILRIDVRTRMVLEEIVRSDLDPVEGIDAFVHASSEKELEKTNSETAMGTDAIRSARSVRNASLVRALPGDATV